MARQLDFPVFDADNHLYETQDAFTRFLPKEHEGLIRYVEDSPTTFYPYSRCSKWHSALGFRQADWGLPILCVGAGETRPRHLPGSPTNRCFIRVFRLSRFRVS